MKVSIIIPIYNVAPYIERCLLSVLNQTYHNIEIILIDDCGTDNSMNIARRVIDKHPNSHLVTIKEHEHNKGLSAARNTGIDTAIGDYIYFLDSDDEISENCIEKLLKSAIENNCDFVIGDYVAIGEHALLPLLNLSKNLNSNRDILYHYKSSNWYPMAVNKLVNRKFMLNNHLYFEEGIIHEDELWSFKLACSAKSMNVVTDKTYLYHIRKNSIMGSIKNKNNIEKSNLSKKIIIEQMYRHIKDNPSIEDKAMAVELFETKKRSFFYTIHLTNSYSRKELFNTYKMFRTLKFNNKVFGESFRNKTMKQVISDFHYMLPVNMGFRYTILLDNIRCLLNNKYKTTIKK